MYDTFINEWGNNIKQVTRFGGECVAAIAEYEADNNLPIVWGDAHQWINNPVMLQAYDWVVNDPSDPNQLPPRGAIIIWGLPNEHIAFFDHQMDNHQFMSYGQNSGGNLLHFQPHSWKGVAGWYILKQPASPPPAPIVHPYTIEEITPKDIVINKQTWRWGMNYDNFTAIAANPIGGVINVGEVHTIRAICHHNIGYDYYLPDPNEPSGFNKLDCDDIPAPPPVAPPTPSAPPAGAMTFPTSTDVYTLVVEMDGYLTSNSAANRLGLPPTKVPPGEYMIFNDRRVDGNIVALNVTKVAGKPGAWINPLDNVIPKPPEPEPSPYVHPRSDTTEPVVPVVVEPVVETWKDTYKPFINLGTGEPEPRSYKVNLGGRIWNLDETGEKATVLLNKGEQVNVYGTVMRDGEKHYRLKLKRDTDFKLWLCVPQMFTDSGGRKSAVLVLPALNWLEKLFHRGEQLKSIFNSDEPKFIDSIQLNPFAKPKKPKK